MAGLTKYEQKYLDCLERRRLQLERLLQRMGFSGAVAIDAAHEAISEALQYVADQTVESLRNRWAWLRGVAIRKAQSNFRRRWRCVVLLDPNTLADNFFVDDEIAEGPNALSACVRSAVDRLPSRLKELVTYCYMQGHTYAEAAKQFQITLGTVSRRLHEARKQLRSELEKFL